MNYFAEALNAALDTVNSNPLLLSEKASLDLSQISQYCQGEALPEIKSLNQILGQFEKPHRLKLITAYLKDHIPSEAADVINVESNSQHVEVQVSHEVTSKLPKDLRHAITHLDNQVASN